MGSEDYGGITWFSGGTDRESVVANREDKWEAIEN